MNVVKSGNEKCTYREIASQPYPFQQTTRNSLGSSHLATARRGSGRYALLRLRRSQPEVFSHHWS